MQLKGNVSSGYYRVALLQIYGKRVLDVGWWGDPEAIADIEYKAAWSIDNAYLHLFLTGGWLGGGSFCLIVATLFVIGGRRIQRTHGGERRVLVALFASFLAVSACLADVWFARADFAKDHPDIVRKIEEYLKTARVKSKLFPMHGAKP